MFVQKPAQEARAFRKRRHVTYAEPDTSEDEDGYQSSDSSASVIVTKRRKVIERPLPKRKIFPFLSLPGELRNQIYMYCLADDGRGIMLSSEVKARRRILNRVPAHGMWDHQCFEDNTNRSYKGLAPEILRLNRQIYNEAMPTLYQNEIAFSDTVTMHTFLAAFSSQNRGLIRHLALKNWAYLPSLKGFNSAALTLLVDCVNLQSFCVQSAILPRHWSLNANEERGKKMGQKLYGYGQYWLEAVARVKGVHAIFDILQLDRIVYGGENARDCRPFNMESEDEKVGMKKALEKLLAPCDRTIMEW